MPRSLLALYAQSPDRYDEMLLPDGRPRPHWQRFFEHVAATPGEEMQERMAFVDRRILENGVTYNVYADPSGADRPWALDPIPLIIPPEEWAEIEAAVTQRATLLNAMLADLYGPQTLLAEGLLPPALVYGQHGYLWPCHGIRPPGDVWLHNYAVDLARSPDGRWWVIADRTQAPSGAGYALENRLIVSRVFPQMFSELHVQHLADFFRSQQEGLAALAPLEGDEQPHVVLLTPGPYNETYFEHAYLSRYLGYPLVEGQDLTVRGDTVFLKTLQGLKRVHVILRRQDDSYCDPLELRGESALGVPGLLNAVRAGRVVVTNALGSGLLGSGALMGFLPGICERLLGEPLAMPSVATWWCGEKPALEYVRKHFDDLVIKAAYPTQRLDPVFGNELSAEEKAAMLRRIEARPHAYVAQEMVALAQGPTWSRKHERRLLPRPVGLRVYVAATPDGYAVMPGGLARVASGSNTRVISMQRGGSAKDAWVLTDGPVSDFTLLKPSLGVRDLVRSGANLSSRVVENLFWLGRYAERFDCSARLLRVIMSRLVEGRGERTPALAAVMELAQHLGNLPDPAAEAAEVLEAALGAAGAPDADAAPAGKVNPAGTGEAAAVVTLAESASDAPAAEGTAPLARPDDRAAALRETLSAGQAKAAAKQGAAATALPDADDDTDEHAVLEAIYDPNQPGSLAGNIRSLMWSATHVRERLSLDHWHSLSRLQREQMGAQRKHPSLTEATAFLDRVLSVSSSLTGFAMDNMTRDDGWRFLIVGRRIERLSFYAQSIAHFLRMPSAGVPGALDWLLEMADSIITYRSRYSRSPELLPVLDLIVFDEHNPHGVMFQAHVLGRYFDRMAREFDFSDGGALAGAVEALSRFDLASLEQAHVGDCREDSATRRLAALLDALDAAAGKVSDALSRRFFTHVGAVSRQTMAV